MAQAGPRLQGQGEPKHLSWEPRVSAPHLPGRGRDPGQARRRLRHDRSRQGHAVLGGGAFQEKRSSRPGRGGKESRPPAHGGVWPGRRRQWRQRGGNAAGRGRGPAPADAESGSPSGASLHVCYRLRRRTLLLLPVSAASCSHLQLDRRPPAHLSPRQQGPTGAGRGAPSRPAGRPSDCGLLSRPDHEGAGTLPDTTPRARGTRVGAGSRRPPLSRPAGDADGGREGHGDSAPSSRLCCAPETALKNKVCCKRKRSALQTAAEDMPRPGGGRADAGTAPQHPSTPRPGAGAGRGTALPRGRAWRLERPLATSSEWRGRPE